jgi:hypothetical protein
MIRIVRLTALTGILVLLVFGCNQTDRPTETAAVPDLGILACEYDYEGCTPGYWKNVRMHGCEWEETGYATTDDFDTVFGTDYFDPDLTLLEALENGGGGYDALGRHGVAALLSAAHPDIHYDLTVNQVKRAVRECDKELLERNNEMGCPLNNCK